MLKIKKWVPFEDLNFDRWYCEGLHDDYEGFRVLLTGEEKPEPIVRLLFEYVYFFKTGTRANFLFMSHQKVIMNSRILSIFSKTQSF